MKVAILTYGTRGDVQPYLAVAHELRARGHEVVVAAPANLVDMVTGAGLEAVAIPIDSHAFVESEEAKGHLTAGRTTAFLKELGELETANRVVVDSAMVTAVTGSELVVTSALAAPRAASIVEAQGQPLLCAYTLPEEPTGDYPSPFLTSAKVPTRMLRRMTHRAFEAAFWRDAEANTAALRARLGLPPSSTNPFVALRRGAVPMMLMASPVLLPTPRDWPAHCTVSGSITTPSALRRGWGEDREPDGLSSWLNDGPPPVYFGFGSMPVLDPGASMAMIDEVAGRLGVRALVGAGSSDVPPGPSDDRQRFVAGAFDHDRLLPRCQAAVHHGGAGTTHTVLRAGLPAVVVHVFADQSLWGARIAALKVGSTFAYPELSADRLMGALRPLLDADVRARAEASGRTLAAERGAAAVADAVDVLLARPDRRRGGEVTDPD